MKLYLYNTLTRNKEEFIPINENEVKMYTCGPTVYSNAHIGNMRAYIFADTLKRTLIYNGYKVNSVMNITDVGHLVSDADEGEDKMEKAAKEKNIDPYKIAEMYTNIFFDDAKRLNILEPTTVCKATEHINEMIEFVKGLVENGYAYETSKGIYFDTAKLKSYGELSKVDLENQLAGARIEVDTEKTNPMDFALWIKAPENHILQWNSPWGKSYPGWHIECSAMSRKYLGDVFDIHTGGVDHIPVHHENEIAQCKGLTGKNPAKTWMHVEFLLVDNGKMSKSLGNVYTIDNITERGLEPLSYRYFNYTAHYRNKLNFTWDSIKSAQTSLNRLRENLQQHKNGTHEISEEIINEYRNRFNEAINDDLNIPIAISIVWEAVKNITKSNKIYKLVLDFDKVLALDLDKENNKIEEIPEEVRLIAEDREKARVSKDWQKSDELREKIKDMGYIVKDSKEGYSLEKII